MSHQTEERYWTDYVRVATPIVGLLLLLGVFWYWANSLIGAESGNPPPTTPAIVTVIAADTPTATATQEVILAPETPTPTPTEKAAQTSPTSEAAEPTETPTEAVVEPTQASGSGRWSEGDPVLSADNGVNLRTDPSTDADVLEVLTLDQPLTIVSSEPTEGGGFVWWHVKDDANDIDGWVVEDWLKDSE